VKVADTPVGYFYTKTHQSNQPELQPFLLLGLNATVGKSFSRLPRIKIPVENH
jgi:hypothetical protein